MSNAESERLKDIALQVFASTVALAFVALIAWMIVKPFLETSKRDTNFVHPEILPSNTTTLIDGKTTFGIDVMAGALSGILYTPKGSPFRYTLPDRISVTAGTQNLDRGGVALRQTRPTSLMWRRELGNPSTFTQNTSLAIDNATDNAYSLSINGENFGTIHTMSHVVLTVRARNYRIDLTNENGSRTTHEVYVGVEYGTYDKVFSSGADLYVLNINGTNGYMVMQSQYRR